MNMTEKLFFRGTPAQFCAVIMEYRLDAEDVGKNFNCEVTYPIEEVILPNLSIPKPRLEDDLDTLSNAINNSIANFESQSGTRHYVVNLRSESPRTVVRCRTGTRYQTEFMVTAIMRYGGGTQLTLRAPDYVWVFVKEAWESIVGYIDNLGYLENTEKIEKLPEPEEWLKELVRMGLSVGSNEWWHTVEKWTRSYWEQKGRSALPLKGRLDKCLACSRKQIYDKTSLGDKTVTLGDTK